MEKQATPVETGIFKICSMLIVWALSLTSYVSIEYAYCLSSSVLSPEIFKVVCTQHCFTFLSAAESFSWRILKQRNGRTGYGNTRAPFRRWKIVIQKRGLVCYCAWHKPLPSLAKVQALSLPIRFCFVLMDLNHKHFFNYGWNTNIF